MFTIKKYIQVLFGLALSASVTSASDKIEIKAKYIDFTQGIVTAKENVVVYQDGKVIKAETALYNKDTKILTLDGNIETIGYNGSKEHSKHMTINTETKEVNFKELFLVSENDVWILSDTVNKKDKEYTLGTSILSSCDIANPLWTMRFSNSTYNTDENYIKLYNAKVYMWDIPVLYTPYLAFSTNKERSSGLLFPLFGYTPDQGFVYEQPFFWAISDSMDLEVNPQIRTSRSVGVYSTLRFVDTDHSKGTLRVGYFKDQANYTQSHGLPNDAHYGLEFNYASTQVFKEALPSDYSDGLYINTTYLNDVDYLTLQKNSLSHFGLNPLQESRINYYVQNNNFYFGLNTKYFIDTRENIDDDKTLQVLPSMQMHKYLDHILFKNLRYSMDIKMKNFSRKSGSTMKQLEMRIPLEFTASVLDDYLSISLAEELYYSKSYFGQGDYEYDNFQYYNNIHKMKLFTDLTKKFDTFTHVLQPSISYLIPGSQNQSPIEFDKLKSTQKELFTVGLPEEQYNFSVSQYFYDDKMNLKFYQRLTQKYYLDRDFQLADLNNEMQYNFDQLKLYNIVGYSHEFKKLRFASTSLEYTGTDYSVSLGHSYKIALDDDKYAREANDVNFNFSYTYNEQITVGGSLTYNIDESSSSQWKFGGRYYRDCWSIDASVRQDIRPTSAGYISENTYYLQLNFTPFGSIGTDTLK
jgi:LPS-assembly protein